MISRALFNKGVMLDALGRGEEAIAVYNLVISRFGIAIRTAYLRGLSTGDFQKALAAPLGKDAPGLSASTISHLKEMWSDEHERWRKRDLSARRYVDLWADGIYLQAGWTRRSSAFSC